MQLATVTPIRAWSTTATPALPKRRAYKSPRAAMLVTSTPAPMASSTPVDLPMAIVASSQASPGIVEQIRTAFRVENRLATIAGGLFGGWVPVATFWVSHYEAPKAHGPLLVALVAFAIGGLTFSARKVYRWSNLALGYSSEALGFTLLTEGVMVVSQTGWLRGVALGLLIAINAIATGAKIARG